MATVSQLAQFLLTQNPQQNVPRLAFYHYVKNFLDLQSELKISDLAQFYNHALGYHYWRDNKTALGETVKQDLDLFGGRHNMGFDLGQVRHAHEIQLFDLKFQRDLENIVKRHLEATSDDADRIRILPLSESEALSLCLRSNGRLSVKTYSNVVALIDGDLQPIGPSTHLEYDSFLELDGKYEQTITTSLMNSVRFRVLNGNASGAIIRGYTFNKTENLLGTITQYPDLFYALKKLERFYVNGQSDPFYHELIATLERGLQWLKSGHPDAPQAARTVLRKGQMALKNIFPNDRLILVLVREIEGELARHDFAPISPLV